MCSSYIIAVIELSWELISRKKSTDCFRTELASIQGIPKWYKRSLNQSHYRRLLASLVSSNEEKSGPAPQGNMVNDVGVHNTRHDLWSCGSP